MSKQRGTRLMVCTRAIYRPPLQGAYNDVTGYQFALTYAVQHDEKSRKHNNNGSAYLQFWWSVFEGGASNTPHI